MLMLKERLKGLVIGTPLEQAARAIFALKGRLQFSSSGSYWESRYKQGGTSGAGSFGRLAAYKAEVVNSFVADQGIKSVIEFGSGDGAQLTLAHYPEYTGVDVSKTAVDGCRARFSEDSTKSFLTLTEYDGRRADLSLSLDVIYHLVEDEIFESYMTMIFSAAKRFVIVYSSNKEEQPIEIHVRHRKFTNWITENQLTFRLHTHIPNRFPFNPKKPENSSFADFYIFENTEQ